jgi:hypothetical protein
MRYSLRTLLILLAIGPPLGAGGCALVPTIPADDMTDTAIGETRVRIHLYMLAKNEVPPHLAALPKREGYANRITDGWGRPLIYSADKEGIITLTSLGRDGKPGGTGDDADVTKRYRTRNKDGSLNDDDPYSEIRDDVKSP